MNAPIFKRSYEMEQSLESYSCHCSCSCVCNCTCGSCGCRGSRRLDKTALGKFYQTVFGQADKQIQAAIIGIIGMQGRVQMFSQMFHVPQGSI